MHSNRIAIGALMITAALAAGCGNPSAGSPEYKEGALGNGSFLFQCDDSVACDEWNNSAEKFPKEIATGSTFNLRFVAKGDQGDVIVINGTAYPGVTVQPIGTTFLAVGPNGFSSLKPGFGTVAARDNKGTIIDYATLTIVKPDALVVYDSNYTGSNPDKIETLHLKAGDQPTFRTVAEHAANAIAGSINVKWSSKDPLTVDIESYTSGVVKIRANKEGTTTLVAEGAALTKEISVEVAQ